MQWKRKAPYLLVIPAGFSLDPKDEFGLEPLLVVMDSKFTSAKRRMGDYNFSSIRFYAFEDELGTSGS